ncbi:hypothetical protein [Nocardioides guangzhouensis]|nr:hypothetical protein [Nocardioides guangzhouensis]
MRTLGSQIGPSLTALLLSILLLAGCGDDSGGTAAGDRTASDGQTSRRSDPAPVGSVPFTEVGLPHATAAGGTVDPTAVPLDSDAAVQDFTAAFDGGELAGDVQDQVAATDVPEGEALVGAVVAIGCDVPPGVAVHRTGDGLEVTALAVKSATVECFAPVTTVALVLVDDDAL